MPTTPQRRRFTLTSAHHPEPTWSRHRTALRALGTFHDPAWLAFADTDPPPVDLLNTLSAVATRFGTHITVTLLPADTPD